MPQKPYKILTGSTFPLRLFQGTSGEVVEFSNSWRALRGTSYLANLSLYWPRAASHLLPCFWLFQLLLGVLLQTHLHCCEDTAPQAERGVFLRAADCGLWAPTALCVWAHGHSPSSSELPWFPLTSFLDWELRYRTGLICIHQRRSLCSTQMSATGGFFFPWALIPSVLVF